MSNFFEGIPSTFLQACLSITCECDFHFKLKLFKYGTLNFHPKKVIQNYSNLIKKVFLPCDECHFLTASLTP